MGQLGRIPAPRSAGPDHRGGGVAGGHECPPRRIERRLATKYVDIMTDSLDEALRLAGEAMKKGTPLSIALLANAADVLPEFVRRGITPDVLTDPTPAPA